MDLNTSISQNNQSTIEERREKLNYLRNLYTLFFIENFTAWLLSSLLILNNLVSLKNFMLRNNQLFIVLFVIVIFIIFLSFMNTPLKNEPLNKIFYGFFVILFSYCIGYFCITDQSYFVYYSIWILNAISFGFMVYS